MVQRVQQAQSCLFTGQCCHGLGVSRLFLVYSLVRDSMVQKVQQAQSCVFSADMDRSYWVLFIHVSDDMDNRASGYRGGTLTKTENDSQSKPYLPIVPHSLCVCFFSSKNGHHATL